MLALYGGKGYIISILSTVFTHYVIHDHVKNLIFLSNIIVFVVEIFNFIISKRLKVCL